MIFKTLLLAFCLINQAYAVTPMVVHADRIESAIRLGGFNISSTPITNNTVTIFDSSGNLISSTTSSGNLVFLDATSSIQTQLNNKDALGAASAAQAYSIQRANQTGTQLSSTISDFMTTVNSSTAFDLAGAAASAQAYSIQRANQTGSQLSSTISDFMTTVDTSTAFD